MNAKKGPVKRGTAKKPAAKKTTAAKAARKPAAKAAVRKPAARKPAAKKPASRKPAAKAAARKPAARSAAKSAAQRAGAKRTSANANAGQTTALARTSNSAFVNDPFNKNPSYSLDANLDLRRPQDNELPDYSDLSQLKNNFKFIREFLEEHAQHMRALDRRRLNGVGMKTMGFIEKAYELASVNQEFLPHYLTLGKFAIDSNRYGILEILRGMAKQIQELLWNMTIESSDILYTDALEFYASVREAAKRRVDAAEAINNELREFFRSRGHNQANGEEEPTEKELLRDFKKTLHGKMDGEVAVRNVKPKITAGRREVIDKKFAGIEQFKETEEASIKE
jgi:hypothetical protein